MNWTCWPTRMSTASSQIWDTICKNECCSLQRWSWPVTNPNVTQLLPTYQQSLVSLYCKLTTWKPSRSDYTLFYFLFFLMKAALENKLQALMMSWTKRWEEILRWWVKICQNFVRIWTFVKIHSTVHHKAWTALYAYWKTISQDVGGCQDRMQTETNESNCMISVLYKRTEGDEVKWADLSSFGK